MTAMQQPDPAARPAVFVLFGATGDPARRMVLPAWYRLACEGLLPRQWMLVGNGRGDITHENFRARVRDALTEFGPKPEGTDWDSFAQRVFFAGGGFSSGNPGSLPDVLGNPRWRDVPFYLRTGKRLAASKQQVSLILREPPGPLAGQLPRDGNVLSFSLAGAGEIDLLLVDKKPGPALDLDVVRAAVPLASLHGADPLPPYVRLIPRRPDRRPLAVHPAGRAGRGVAGGRAAAHQPAPGPRVRARLVGAGPSPRAHRARAMAPGPVTTRPRHRPARWTDPGSLRLRASGSSTLPASVSATRMTVPVEQGGRETAFQGLDHAADLSELHAAARPSGRAERWRR